MITKDLHRISGKSFVIMDRAAAAGGRSGQNGHARHDADGRSDVKIISRLL
jgi:hypothetical protein